MGRTRSAEPPTLRAIDKSSETFELTYFDPPPGLEHHVLTLFELRFYNERVEDLHIGALGQLCLIVRGRLRADFGERTDDLSEEPMLFTAFDVATPFRADGAGWVLGASFTPYGWASLTQASVKDHRNRFIPAGELLGEDVDRLHDRVAKRRLSGKLSCEQACMAVADWIRPRLNPIPASHEDVIDQTLAWLGSSLNPPVEELFADASYSRRQVERLVQRYFGVPPRALARKFRAIRAANLLAEPKLTDEGEAEIADAFVDQPHMIREIRRFCGYTPSRLGGPADPLFIRLTNMQNLDRFRPYRPIGTGGRSDGPPL
ncbi:MAG: helix-turn-helix domain-containing protein [Pseudomonadota bacterium]